ncbi:MAG: ATP-binding protein DrrA1-3 family domain-containing protein, partial [Nocardioidaceae bacterium]
AYGAHTVLDGIDHEVPAGTVFSLIGPNGAGTTTMVQILSTLVAGGVTIFLTTQYLEEADELADRIALLDRGRLVAVGTATELKRLVPGGHVELRFADPAVLAAVAGAHPGASADEDALTLKVPSDGSARSLRALLDRLDPGPGSVASLSVHTPDLDDVFLALTSQATEPDRELVR